MATAEPDEARRLARRLAVKWDELEMTIEASSRSNLTVEERAAIFRAGMEAELAIAVGDLLAPRRVSDGQPGFQKIMAGAYSAILNVAADADGVPDEIVNQVTKGDWTDEERNLVRQMLAAFVTPAEINAARLEAALRKVGAPVSETTKHEARASLLRGMIEAQRRAELFHHPLIEASGDQLAGLLDDSLVMEARRGQLSALHAPQVPTPASNQTAEQAPTSLLFARVTEIRFSEQIDDLVGKMFADNKWKPDDGRTKHMLEAFAWLTGDKKMSDYEPEDADEFVRRMARIPLGFKWGKLNASGGMAVPFSLSAFPEVDL